MFEIFHLFPQNVLYPGYKQCIQYTESMYICTCSKKYTEYNALLILLLCIHNIYYIKSILYAVYLLFISQYFPLNWYYVSTFFISIFLISFHIDIIYKKFNDALKEA